MSWYDFYCAILLFVMPNICCKWMRGVEQMFGLKLWGTEWRTKAILKPTSTLWSFDLLYCPSQSLNIVFLKIHLRRMKASLLKNNPVTCPVCVCPRSSEMNVLTDVASDFRFSLINFHHRKTNRKKKINWVSIILCLRAERLDTDLRLPSSWDHPPSNIEQDL